MKILHVYRTYFPDTHGGLEEVIRQVCLTTRAAGMENRVFTLSEQADPAVIERPECTVFRSKRTFEVASCGFSLAAPNTFRPLVEWADLIHYHYPWPFADGLHLLYGRRTPAIVTYHSDIVRQKLLQSPYAPLRAGFLDSVDAIVATSPNYAETSPVLSRYRNKLAIIPIGLDESSFPEESPESSEWVQREFGRDYFLFIGVLRYYKGLHTLLSAARHAPFSAVVVGDGPMATGLHKQAAELGVNNVKFAGYLPDRFKASLYRNARAVVFPSSERSEAFGLTLVEGAMYGKPLISTEVGTGTSYVNQHDETGLIVSPNCPAELRTAMERLHADPDLAATMGRRARARYENYFTACAMGAEYRLLYSRVLGQGHETT